MKGRVMDDVNVAIFRLATATNSVTDKTVRLVRSLRAFVGTVDDVAANLMTGRMTSVKQQEYADLLLDLACVTEEHADTSRVDVNG
jgi:hypothetical protein